MGFSLRPKTPGDVIGRTKPVFSKAQCGLWAQSSHLILQQVPSPEARNEVRLPRSEEAAVRTAEGRWCVFQASSGTKLVTRKGETTTRYCLGYWKLFGGD